jgi:hypothetical protein
MHMVIAEVFQCAGVRRDSLVIFPSGQAKSRGVEFMVVQEGEGRVATVQIPVSEIDDVLGAIREAMED